MSFVIVAFITTKHGSLRVVTRENHNRSKGNVVSVIEYEHNDTLYNQFRLLESLSLNQDIKAGNAYEITDNQLVGVGDIHSFHKFSQPVQLTKLLRNGETATALTKKHGCFIRVAKIAHTIVFELS